MTHAWTAKQSAATLSQVLLTAALISLQVSLGGARLVYELPAYFCIGLAAIIGVATFRRGAVDILCLSTAAVFAGFVSVRALASAAPYYARADLYVVLAAFAVYGLTATALDGARHRMAVLAVLLTFALCHVLVALVQFGVGQNLIFLSALREVEATPRPSGLYGGPAYLAGLLEVLGVFAVSITCWSRWPKWAKVLVGYLALTCYVGIALTGSRGGYLGVATSLLAFGVLSLFTLRGAGSSAFWKWGVAGVIGLALAIWLGTGLMRQSAYLTQRAQNVGTADEARFDLWRAAIKQWQLQPWIGTGSGTYRFYGREFRAERMQPDPVAVHNDYLHLLCEYGIAGAVAFLAFFGTHLRAGWGNFRRLGPQRLAAGSFPLSDRLALNLGALASISAYMVHSAVDFNLHIPANALLMAFVFGIAANPGANPADQRPPKSKTTFPRILIAAVALILLVQCVRLWPGEYYAERARIALQNEDPSTAIGFATEALVHEQQNPRIFFYLGRSFVSIGDAAADPEKINSFYEQALAAFEKARQLNPLDGNHPFDMAMIYDRMGRFAEAEWMYGLARARDPASEPMAHRYKSHLNSWRRAGLPSSSGKLNE